MTTPQVVDQELVIHLFAPLEGPRADAAYRLIREVWSACQREFGMVSPIPGIGLPMELPAALSQLSAVPVVAAQEHPGANLQAVARRDHDVLNLSLVLASSPRTTTRLGSKSDNWAEQDAMWSGILGDQADPLLGQTRLYLAKVSDAESARIDASVALAHALRPLLPLGGQSVDWPERGITIVDGFAIWEISPRKDTRNERRILAAASHDHDAELSAWTWSCGDPSMPPFARYLMHAAKIRYQLQVWDDGQRIRQLRQRADTSSDDLRGLIVAGRLDSAAASLRRLRADEVDIVHTLASIREMRQTVLIATANMIAALAGNVPDPPGQNMVGDDLGLAEWFAQQLEDGAEYLDIAVERIHRVSEIVGGTSPIVSSHDPVAPGPRIRMVFTVDIVGYSKRSEPRQRRIQNRLLALVDQVLEDIDVNGPSSDKENTGDGLNVYLPVDIDYTRALPTLIRATAQRIADDNTHNRDRLRLRMAIGMGPVIPGPPAFAGAAIIQVSRLLDCAALRGTIEDHPDVNLAILVSDLLYSFVIGAGHRGIPAKEFRRVRATTKKDFEEDSWLWCAYVKPNGD